nr:hypothetical protein [Tanacetum cinerariifolium]
MTSFDYHLNPPYPIKECSSCEALYTTDYCCSDGSLVDKIICDLNKTPNLPQWPLQNYPKFGNPVDGQYCQGCVLLQKELKEVWFTICEENGILQGLLDTFESSNDNTNVVNAPQEPFFVKQDPDIFCHQCTCESCGKGAYYGYNCPSKILIIPNPEPYNNQTIDELPQTLPSFDPTCYSGDENSFTYDSKSNIVDDSPNVFNPPLQPPTYSYEFCRNDTYYGHDCPLQVLFTYDPEPCYNQDFNFPQNFQIFQQQYLCCTHCGGPHETCQCDQLIFDEPYCENYEGSHMSFQCQPINQNHYEPNPCYDSNSFSFDQFQPPQFPIIHQPIHEKTYAELLAEERAANINTQPFQYSFIHQPPQEEISVEFLTVPFQSHPVLSTEEPDNSLSMGDEHLDTIPAMESDEVIKSSVENLVPILSESEGIPDNMCDVPFHDNSPPFDISKDKFVDFSESNDDSTSIDDNSFFIDDIEYVEASPLDSELVSLKSSSTSLNFLLEETNNFDNSLPESETFCFNQEESSSGSTTTRSDYYLLDYEAFYNNHVKEGLVVAVPLLILIFLFMINSSLIFRSIHFLLSIGVTFIMRSLPMSSLTSYLHRSMIVSPLRMNPTRGDFIMDVVEDIFPTREPRVHVHNVLPTHPTLQLNLDFILSSESLFAYVVWIFLSFLSYSVAPQYLLSFENEDTIFDPKCLNGSPMEILFPTCSPMDQ